MLKRTIIIEAVKESFLQPSYLFSVIIEVSVFILIIFGFQFEYRQDILVSLKFIGRTFEDAELVVFKKELVTNLTSMLTSVLMFLFILVSSYFILRTITHPLIPVILTRTVTRTVYYLSNFFGLIISIMINIFSFSIICSVILYAKGSTWPSSLFYASISFCLEFIVIASTASVFSILTGSSSASVILTVSLYYILSPLLLVNPAKTDYLLKFVAVVIPNFYETAAQTRAYFLGNHGVIIPYIKGIAYAAICQVICLIIFLRRDLH